jgi:hypothetical protein
MLRVKKYQFSKNGINKLNNYNFIKKYYLNFTVKKNVVLCGSKENKLLEIKAPGLFRETIKNMLKIYMAKNANDFFIKSPLNYRVHKTFFK